MKWLLAILTLALCAGCKPDFEEMAPLAQRVLPADIRVNSIRQIAPNTWIAGGGIRNQEGHLLRSEDNGHTWTDYINPYLKSIYTIHFTDSLNGLAGGDFLHLWKTENGGRDWTFVWLADQVPFNGEDRSAIRDIYRYSPSHWEFCGGENWGEGILYSTLDGGEQWEYKTTAQELRCLETNRYGQTHTAGFGMRYLFDDAPLSAVAIPEEGVFYTGSDHLYELYFFSDYNGSVICYDERWQSKVVLMDSNKLFRKRIQWNDILSNEDYLLAVGNEGYFAYSTDQGQNWTLKQINNEAPLLCVARMSDGYWAGSEHGKLYRIL